MTDHGSNQSPVFRCHLIYAQFNDLDTLLPFEYQPCPHRTLIFFRSKPQESEFMCMTGKIDFGCNNFLQCHYRLEHYQCKACSKMFSLEGLKHHYLLEPLCKLIVTHNAPCEICGLGQNIRNRLGHYKVHEDHLINPLSCFLCPENPNFSSSQMLLYQHIKQNHNWPKYFSCGYCQTAYGGESFFSGTKSLKTVKDFLDHLKTCWTPLTNNQSADEQIDLDLSKTFKFKNGDKDRKKFKPISYVTDVLDFV